MVKIKHVNQKLKGKLQQITGDIQIANNQPVKGNINRLKGKANEAVADIKSDIES
jgi:uncharacterized protein YjbJ (UPF0337 family)